MNLTLLSWRIQFVESGRHCHLHAFTCHERNISFATTASDNAVAHATWYLSSFKPLVLANFLFCLRDINLTLGLLPLRGHVVWRDSVGVESSRSELNSECADIFHQSSLWLLRHTDEPQRGRNSCLWHCSILPAEFNMSTFHFCWSGLYRSYVLRHIRLRSFAVLCG